MATIRAFRAFDMRIIVRDGDLDRDDDSIDIRDGVWRTVFTGEFEITPHGATGTLQGFSQTHDERRVFEATGVERSAATAFAIIDDRDNDAFLAYTLSGADRIVGSDRDDHLLGFGDDDDMSGGAGDDRLFGGSGSDTVVGGRGADFLAGGRGADVLRGGFGDDTYDVDRSGDRVIEAEGGGYDTVLSRASLRIFDNVERLVLIGDARIDARGGGGADDLNGNEAGNGLTGGAGRDTLDGDGGGDRLDGGLGRDTLTGGRGADVFRFGAAGEANRDRILDFGDGADRIDLSVIDADATRGGHQRFAFVGDDALSGRAGELQLRSGRLAGDLDGDGRADFAILLDPDADLVRADLIL